MSKVAEIGKGVEGVKSPFPIKPKLGGTTGLNATTIAQQFDGRWIVLNSSGLKCGGPWDSVTGAYDAKEARDSIFFRNAQIDAIPVISFLSWTGFGVANGFTGPHG